MSDDTTESHPIIFFDGVCNLCNGVVDLLLRLDRDKQFRFASLQGETARDLLPPLGDDARTWSFVYYDEDGAQLRSDAALAVCQRLGGIWWLLSLARFVPRFLRDPVYRLVARYRYRVFGQRETCRLPTPEEKARFLP